MRGQGLKQGAYAVVAGAWLEAKVVVVHALHAQRARLGLVIVDVRHDGDWTASGQHDRGAHQRPTNTHPPPDPPRRQAAHYCGGIGWVVNEVIA